MGLEAGGVGPSSRVLVQGGSDAVGSFAIQLAKARGAHVVATCCTQSIDYCKVGVAPPRDWARGWMERACVAWAREQQGRVERAGVGQEEGEGG